MPSVLSPNKSYELMATGENQGTWGVKTNANLSLIDLNFGGRFTQSVAGNTNVTITTSQAENIYHRLTGLLTGNIAYIVPMKGSTYVVQNATTGAFSITVRMASGAGVVVPQGTTAMLFADPNQTAVVPVLTAPGGALNMGGFGISNAATPVASTDVANKSYVDAAIAAMTATLDSLVPIGIIVPYTGYSVPTAGVWAYPAGQAVSRTTYATLFSRVGVTYGAGNGSTTFNLPDLRGRSMSGLDDLGGSAANRITFAGSGIVGTTLGAVGGAQNVTLSIADIPSHNHGGSTGAIGDHTHPYSAPTTAIQTLQLGAGINAVIGGSATTGPAGAHSHTIPSQGGGAAHFNMPPTMMMTLIMRIL